MIGLDDKLKKFGKASFLLMIINSHKSEIEIDRNVETKHIKDDFIAYINHITIELADRNRLFAKALYHFMNRIKEFDIKHVIALLMHIKANFIDSFNRTYKLLLLEYKEIKKTKITKLNRVEITNKILNFNRQSHIIHNTYLEFEEGFLNYVIDYLELLGLEYSENIKEIYPLQKSEIEFLTDTRNYIDNIFGKYHKLEISLNEERE